MWQTPFTSDLWKRTLLKKCTVNVRHWKETGITTTRMNLYVILCQKLPFVIIRWFEFIEHYQRLVAAEVKQAQVSDSRAKLLSKSCQEYCFFVVDRIALRLLEIRNPNAAQYLQERFSFVLCLCDAYLFRKHYNILVEWFGRPDIHSVSAGVTRRVVYPGITWSTCSQLAFFED